MSEIEASKAAAIIKDNFYMSLSTVYEGKPWASPVFYAFDANLNFYFHSRKESRHSVAISQDPHVAFSIFDSTKSSAECDGLQVAARCFEMIGGRVFLKLYHYITSVLMVLIPVYGRINGKRKVCI